jgi:hypothetical protein
MAQRVTATFRSREDADRATAALVDLGANRYQISTLSRSGDAAAYEDGTVLREGHDTVEPAREVGDEGAPLTTTDEAEAAHGAATGATIGAVAGIAAGLLSLLVPGVGLVTAGGALAWALAGAVGTAAAGAVAGGVIGGLHDLGIGEEHAQTYAERVRQGDILLTAVAPPVDEKSIENALRDCGAENVAFTQDFVPASAYTDTPAVGMGGEVRTPITGEWRDNATGQMRNPRDILAPVGDEMIEDEDETYDGTEIPISQKR